MGPLRRELREPHGKFTYPNAGSLTRLIVVEHYQNGDINVVEWIDDIKPIGGAWTTDADTDECSLVLPRRPDRGRARLAAHEFPSELVARDTP
jgi:hypothetical protein